MKNRMNMKNRMKMLCGGLVVLLASCSSQVTHTNYYFDSANGNDANSGTSVQTPFKSLAKLKELTLKGGDSVLLKSGTVFTEKLFFSIQTGKFFYLFFIVYMLKYKL